MYDGFYIQQFKKHYSEMVQEQFHLSAETYQLNQNERILTYLLFMFSIFSLFTILKMTAFWNIVPRSLVEVDHFRRTYYLHHHGDK
jgi:hypothetical protein